MANSAFQLWDLTGDSGAERAKFQQAAAIPVTVPTGDYEAITLYRAVSTAGHKMSYVECLDLHLWEIAVLLGKGDAPDTGNQNDEVDAMLRDMNPRQPSSDRKG